MLYRYTSINEIREVRPWASLDGVTTNLVMGGQQAAQQARQQCDLRLVQGP